MEEVVRDVVVDRGDDPRPPRELLPMTLPADLAIAEDETEDEEPKDNHQELRPMPRRGPEITEIG